MSLRTRKCQSLHSEAQCTIHIRTAPFSATVSLLRCFVTSPEMAPITSIPSRPPTLNTTSNVAMGRLGNSRVASTRPSCSTATDWKSVHTIHSRDFRPTGSTTATDLPFQFSDAAPEISTIINDPCQADGHSNGLTICHSQDSTSTPVSNPGNDVTGDKLLLREAMQCIGSCLRDVEAAAAENPQGVQAKRLEEFEAQLQKRGIPVDWFTKPWSEKTASEETSSLVAITLLIVLGLITGMTVRFAIVVIKFSILRRRFERAGADVNFEPRSRLPFGLRRGQLGDSLGPPVSLELEDTAPPVVSSEPDTPEEIAEGVAADTSSGSVSPTSM